MAAFIWNNAIHGVGDATNTPGVAAAAAAVGSIISIKFPDGINYKGIITEKSLHNNVVTIMFKEDEDGTFDTQVNVNLNMVDFQLGGTIEREALETFVLEHGEQDGSLLRARVIQFILQQLVIMPPANVLMTTRRKMNNQKRGGRRHKKQRKGGRMGGRMERKIRRVAAVLVIGVLLFLILMREGETIGQRANDL